MSREGEFVPPETVPQNATKEEMVSQLKKASLDRTDVINAVALKSGIVTRDENGHLVGDPDYIKAYRGAIRRGGHELLQDGWEQANPELEMGDLTHAGQVVEDTGEAAYKPTQFNPDDSDEYEYASRPKEKEEVETDSLSLDNKHNNDSKGGGLSPETPRNMASDEAFKVEPVLTPENTEEGTPPVPKEQSTESPEVEVVEEIEIHEPEQQSGETPELPEEEAPVGDDEVKEKEQNQEAVVTNLEKLISFEKNTVRVEWLSVQLELLKSGSLNPDEMQLLVQYLEAEKTTYRILGETVKRTNEREIAVDADEAARYIDMLYGEEDYLNKVTTFDERHADVLKELYESVKDGTHELSDEEFQANLDFLTHARDLLVEKIKMTNEAPNPAANSEEITVYYNAEELTRILGIYDQLIENLETYRTDKEASEKTLFEEEITTIDLLLVDLKLLIGKENEVPEQEEKKEQELKEQVPVEEEPHLIGPEKVLIADISEVLKAMAWRIAENQLNAIINRERTSENEPFLGGVARFFRGSLAKLGERGYLAKLYNEALDGLEQNQDLKQIIAARLQGRSEVVNRGVGDKSETYEVLDSVIEQMENDVLEREENGEDLEKAAVYFQDLFLRHMRGEFAGREEFEQAATAIIRELISGGAISPEQFAEGRGAEAEGLMFATNLWQLAEANKQRVFERYSESGEWQKLSEAEKEAVMEHVRRMGELDVRLALKFSDLEEQRQQRPGRIEERLSDIARNHVILGAIVNPAVMGFAMSGLTSKLARGALLAGIAAGGITGGFAFAGPVLAGAMTGATIGGIKRSRNLNFDRGMEQRREALGVEGQGRRAERLRERGFARMAGDARELTARIESGDTGAAVEAAALLHAQRALRMDGRRADLIFVGAEDSERTGSNLPAITDLKVALKNFEAENGVLNEDRIAERVAELTDYVRSQDWEYRKYNVKQSFAAAGYSALTGAVAAVVAQEVMDRLFHGETLWGKTNDRITLLEYFRGQRPQAAEAAYFNLADGTPRGEDVQVGEIVRKPITLPGRGVVEAAFELKEFKDGKPEWEVRLPKLPKGFSFDEAKGVITHKIGEVKGGTDPSEWLKTRSQIAERFGLNKIRASWLKHATNGTSPVGNSYGEGFRPNSNGSELEMDFIQRKDGSVVVSVARALGHTAFGDGHKMTLTPENMDELVATVSPHSQNATGGQHDALALLFDSKGHSQPIPKELAQEIFSGKGSELKNNLMVTVNQVIGHDHGKTRLFEIAADLGNGKSGNINIPGESEVIKLPDLNGDYIPPVEAKNADMPWAIPFDKRRPIGNPRVKSENKEVINTDYNTGSGGFASVPEMGAGLEAASQAAFANQEESEEIPEAPKQKKKTSGLAHTGSGGFASVPEMGAGLETGENEESLAPEKAKNRVEIGGLQSLTKPDLRNLYNRITALYHSEGLTGEEKRKEYARYLKTYFSEPTAKKLSTVKTGTHNVDISKLSPENFERLLGTIARRIEEELKER